MSINLRRCLNALAFLLCAGVATWQLSSFWQPPSAQVLDVQEVGWWRLALAHPTLLAGEPVTFFLRFECEGCYERLKEAYLAMGKASGVANEFMRFRGSRRAFRAKVRIPRRTEEPLHACVVLVGQDGALYAAS
jgi:hypothetical protein